MAIQKATVKIRGTTPILMHAFPMTPQEGIDKQPAEIQAEACAYRTPKTGKFYVPGVNVQRSLISGATYCKGKGRASLQKPAAACMMVSPEYLILSNQKPLIDSRPVVNPSTKGRIIRHRYKFDPWEIEFVLEWDDVLIGDVQARKIVDETCSRVGFLDFRPERKGPFGRAVVISWNTDGRK